MTDADALIPDAPPTDADPIAAEPPAGADVGDVDAFDEATPDEPLSQPSPIERLPMNEQDVPGRLVPFTVVEPNAEEVVPDSVLVVDVPAPNVVPFWMVP